jgi:hypothetical protein
MAESLPATRKSVHTEKTYILQDVGNTDTNSTAAVESGTINKVCNEIASCNYLDQYDLHTVKLRAVDCLGL